MDDAQKKTGLLRVPLWNELPEIPLYMDQLIWFIGSTVGVFFAEAGLPGLTHTMVNNYVRAGIVDAPVKKKYSKQSLAMIIVVYILKTCYSTEEISKLIQMGLAIEGGTPEVIYNRFCSAIEDAMERVFSGEIHLKDEKLQGRENKYLMDSFALSFACKMYVQKEFLMKVDS